MHSTVLVATSHPSFIQKIQTFASRAGCTSVRTKPSGKTLQYLKVIIEINSLHKYWCTVLSILPITENNDQRNMGICPYMANIWTPSAPWLVTQRHAATQQPMAVHIGPAGLSIALHMIMTMTGAKYHMRTAPQWGAGHGAGPVRQFQATGNYSLARRSTWLLACSLHARPGAYARPGEYAPRASKQAQLQLMTQLELHVYGHARGHTDHTDGPHEAA